MYLTGTSLEHHSVFFVGHNIQRVCTVTEQITHLSVSGELHADLYALRPKRKLLPRYSTRDGVMPTLKALKKRSGLIWEVQYHRTEGHSARQWVTVTPQVANKPIDLMRANCARWGSLCNSAQLHLRSFASFETVTSFGRCLSVVHHVVPWGVRPLHGCCKHF